MKTVVITGAGVALVLSIPLFLQVQKNGELQTELAALRESVGELEELREENAALRAARVDTNEVARLRADHVELLRLRGQVGQMRQDLEKYAALESRLAAEAAAATPTNPPAAPAEPSAAFTADLTARVANRETLVTGGWSTAPGRRTLVLLTPLISPATSPAKVVAFRSTIIDAPEEVWNGIGLAEFKSDGQRSALQGALNAEQTDTIVKTLQGTEGVSVLASPMVKTADDQPARVQVGGAAGPSVSISVQPRVAPDRQSLEVSVNAQLSPDAPAAAPTEPSTPAPSTPR